MILLKRLLIELFDKRFQATGQPAPNQNEFIFGVHKNIGEDSAKFPFRISVKSNNIVVQPHYPITSEELVDMHLNVGDRAFIDMNNPENPQIPEIPARIREYMLNNLRLTDVKIKP